MKGTKSQRAGRVVDQKSGGGRNERDRGGIVMPTSGTDSCVCVMGLSKPSRFLNECTCALLSKKDHYYYSFFFHSMDFLNFRTAKSRLLRALRYGRPARLKGGHERTFFLEIE